MNETNIGKYIIKYNNTKEFHTLKSEIFGEECYSVDLYTEKPYIIDIGAYIGLSTIYFKSMYPNAKILSLEPNPYSREVLEENIFLNNLQNIEISPYAIDTSKGERIFFLDSSENIWHSTAGFSKNSWNGEYTNGSSIKVKTIPLRYLLDKHVDLLKMDIEGIEGKVLKEAGNTLLNVRNIIVEYHPTSSNNLKKISSLLESKGFNLSFFKDGKEITNPDNKNLLILKGNRDQ